MINRREFMPDTKLARTVHESKRANESMKATQQVGGDAILVAGTPPSGPSTGVALVSPGDGVLFQLTYLPVSGRLTNPSPYFTVYVDDDDPPHQFPFTPSLGGSLTANQMAMTLMWWPDWATSDDTGGMRHWFIFIRNDDSKDHEYYIQAKVYAPILEASLT